MRQIEIVQIRAKQRSSWPSTWCIFMGFGIDFGTTNSAVVYNETTRLDTGADRPFPSVVAIDNMTGKVVACGQAAKAKIGELTENDCTVITSVKRHIERGNLFRAGDRTFGPREIA